MFPTKTDKKTKKKKSPPASRLHSLLQRGRQDLSPWRRVVCPPLFWGFAPPPSAAHSASLPLFIVTVACGVRMNIHELQAPLMKPCCQDIVVQKPSAGQWEHFIHTKMSFIGHRWMCDQAAAAAAAQECSLEVLLFQYKVEIFVRYWTISISCYFILHYRENYCRVKYATSMLYHNILYYTKLYYI